MKDMSAQGKDRSCWDESMDRAESENKEVWEKKLN